MCEWLKQIAWWLIKITSPVIIHHAIRIILSWFALASRARMIWNSGCNKIVETAVLRRASHFFLSRSVSLFLFDILHSVSQSISQPDHSGKLNAAHAMLLRVYLYASACSNLPLIHVRIIRDATFNERYAMVETASTLVVFLFRHERKYYY